MNYSRLFQFLTEGYALGPYHALPQLALPPLNVIYETTYRCNLRCQMCQFYREGATVKQPGSFAEDLDTDEALKVIRQVPRHALLTLTGGEPWARRDIMELIRAGCERGPAHVITNGTMVSSGEIEELALMAATAPGGRGLYLVGISIQGLGEEHDEAVRRKGAFERSIGAMQQLIEARQRWGRRFPLVNFKTVITPRTVESLEAMYDLAGRIGADFFNAIVHNDLELATPVSSTTTIAVPEGKDRDRAHPGAGMVPGRVQEVLTGLAHRGGPPVFRITPPGWQPRDVELYYRNEARPEMFRCLAPWSKLIVTSTGDFQLCPFNRLGNARQISLAAVWNSPAAREFRKRVRAAGAFEACAGCCFLSRRPGPDLASEVDSHDRLP